MPHPKTPHQPDMQGVARTLFLPLSVRAQATMWCPWLDPQDRHAMDLLQRCGAVADHPPVDRLTAINILWRTHRIKAAGQDFFQRFGHVKGVNLGAGLADYFQWLDNGQNHWMNVDLPEVVALRQQLLPDSSERCDTRSEDLRVPGWWDRLELPKDNHRNPLLLIVEGVLMYLQPCEVKAFLQEIGEHAPEGTELLCDFISPVGIGQLTPTLPLHEGVSFTWGARNAQELASFHPRLELLEQHSVAEAYGWCGNWLEMLYAPLTGGPLYGLAHLKVSDDL